MVWCDNCLLLFPLRGGAMALALLIAAYSIAGGIILFMYGETLFFLYPEAQIYGGIAMAVAAVSLLSMIAYANSSYMWTRLLFFIMPLVFIVSIARAGLMIFRLDYYQANVIWECNHGGEIWTAEKAAIPNYIANSSSTSIPTGFCSAGFHTLYLAFAFALCIDCILQIYQWFMIWRFKARLQEYFRFTQKSGGIYTA
ncbi:uncharacterized protein JCM6883_003860 [Sporobolomyces salmoneus]|uniref:uncharacterized protein n=1 Tax=Sporobolomyces salmoneus TaxID=183962 RepID=UPI003176D2A7